MTKLQLSIYLKETDRHDEVPLHEYIVRRLLHSGISGATVLRGVMGYGRHGHVHRTRLFGVSDDRPVVVVAIDDEALLLSFLPELKAIAPGALVVAQHVEVL